MEQKAAEKATVDQMMTIHRRMTETIPLGLTSAEAEAICSTGGFFTTIEKAWEKQLALISETAHYRKRIEWAIFIMAFVIPVLKGITLSILWEWFIVATYALPPIPIPAAIGIMIMIAFITADLKRHEWKDSSYRIRFWRIILVPFIWNGLFLGFGWFFQLFI